MSWTKASGEFDSVFGALSRFDMVVVVELEKPLPFCKILWPYLLAETEPRRFWQDTEAHKTFVTKCAVGLGVVTEYNPIPTFQTLWTYEKTREDIDFAGILLHEEVQGSARKCTIGCPPGIRTPIDRFRADCSTIELGGKVRSVVRSASRTGAR
jgi:hypothetical protein